MAGIADEVKVPTSTQQRQQPLAPPMIIKKPQMIIKKASMFLSKGAAASKGVAAKKGGAAASKGVTAARAGTKRGGGDSDDDDFDPMMSFVQARKAGKTNTAGTNVGAARPGLGAGAALKGNGGGGARGGGPGGPGGGVPAGVHSAQTVGGGGGAGYNSDDDVYAAAAAADDLGGGVGRNPARLVLEGREASKHFDGRRLLAGDQILSPPSSV
jgi:hypothetical protein